MALLYRDLLVATCAGLLLWGLIRTDRIYQYPFLMGAIFISFLVPQAYALVKNPSPVSQDALERVLVLSSVCAVACWVGYQLKPNRSVLKNLNFAVDQRKLLIAGMALMAQGWFFNILLSRTAVQTADNGNWTGPATIYLFFTQATNIGFGIFLLQLLRRPTLINLTCAMISGWPLLTQVLIGRRQPTMTFLIIIGFALFSARRYVPPRWLIIGGVSIIAFLIPAFGALRSDFWGLLFSGNWQEVLAQSQEAFKTQQSGELLELRNAALLIDIADRTGEYGYGTGWWDSIVFQFVPGQIVGFGVKKSLQFGLTDNYDELLLAFYNYTPPNGYTNTGIADSFVEFSYFGFLAFVLMGYIFKHLWVSAVYYNSTFSQILYMGLVSPAMVALTHGVGRFWQESIFQLIFVGMAFFYSRTKYVPEEDLDNYLQEYTAPK